MCQSVQDGVEKLNESGFESISTDIVKPAGLKRDFSVLQPSQKLVIKRCINFG